jgi:2-polyprenyl-6-methoxyphenol hydroxylase-like FAD-dependent oxidoreductase
VNGEAPVLICGAGPTGLALALELARFGVPFRLIDRAREAARYSQALAVQARTLELLEASGLTAKLLFVANEVGHVHVTSGRRTLLDLSTAKLPTDYPFVAVIPQEETERAMIVRLNELGVTVERDVALAHVEPDGTGVTVELATPRGKERLAVRYLAACDGAHSTIRHLLDVPFSGHAVPEAFSLADVRLETPLRPDTAAVHLGTQGEVLVAIPMRELWRLVVELRREPPEFPDAAYFQAVLGRFGIPAKIERIEWAANFHVHQRKVDRYRVGPTFFLGDAAHIHSPVGGQGMNTGIGDAVNLAWKLALVVNDGVDPRLLDTYHDEREAVARALLRGTEAANRLVLQAGPVLRRLRDTVAPLATRLPPVRDRVLANAAQLSIGYSHSRLSVNGSPERRGLRAGMRVRGARPAGYRPQTVLVPATRSAPAMTVVVRPDGYAGYVSDGAHAHGAKTYLRNVIGLTNE